MQALDGYKMSRTIPRVKMEVHSPTSVPRSLSPIEQYSKSPILSSSPTSFSSPSRHRLKREYNPPLKMDPHGYEHDSWNNFIYNTDLTEQQQHFAQDDMNAPQPYTIFPTSYGVSQGNLNQVDMISHQQWNMNSHVHQHPQADLQYPQAYYPTTSLAPSQPIPHMAGAGLMPMSAHYQQQPWSNSVPPQYTNTSTTSHGRIQHQRTPSSPNSLAFAPIVPSSSPGEGGGGGNDSSDNEPLSSSQPSLSTRYNTAVNWLNRTSAQLTPAQIHIARYILGSSWWESESVEPELRANDELVVKGLMSPGGSRFRAFLDEESGWKCTFDHDGVPCQHGKGRMERALGTVRGFFVYKPVTCGGGCGTRCEQRFVSVEQCQKHVQKKRSGRVACSECGTSILPANMSRHRRACHAAP